MLRLPRVYPIVDAAFFVPGSEQLFSFAMELLHAGATLLQYRNKFGSPWQMLADARELRRLTRAAGARLILNDRPDLAMVADCDGVHLGQDDLPPEDARRIFALEGERGAARWIGFSTHNPEQLREADSLPVDYLAIGPVFTTASKQKPDPVVGLEGVRAARALTRKPLVAIGGITLENAPQVIEAGADAVALIAALRHHPGKSFAAFQGVLG